MRIWLRAAAGLAAAALLAIPAYGGAVAPTWPQPPRPADPPNVLLIVTDDQRWDAMAHMPTVNSQIVDKGMTFTNMFATNSLCCPSRASIFTGDFSHTNGVYRNEPWFGAFPWLRDSSTIATWLQSAGYTTALFGKYIDGYQSMGNAGYVPPGWSNWEAFIHAGFYDYALTRNGTVTRYGSEPADYSTTVVGSDATAYVRSAPTTKPLFLEFAPEAPHAPAIPESKYANAFANLPSWNPPNMNAGNIPGQPSYMRSLPMLTPGQLAAQENFRRNQYRTLLSVDDQVRSLLQAYADTGRLSNTLVIYTSDNGLSWGEHRWVKKEVPYDESLRLPLAIRYDPITGGVPSTNTDLVLNADLAPTIAAAAGAAHPPTDGSSLLQLLRGDAAGWRHDFVLEHMRGANNVPTYCGVRTQEWKYVSYQTGEEELYNLRTDPYELRNLAHVPADAAVKAQLAARTTQLCDPAPVGYGSGRPAAIVAGLLLALAALAGASALVGTSGRRPGADPTAAT